jgi:hypothetical protein
MEGNVTAMRESLWRELRDKDIMFNPLTLLPWSTGGLDTNFPFPNQLPPFVQVRAPPLSVSYRRARDRLGLPDPRPHCPQNIDNHEGSQPTYRPMEKLKPSLDHLP